MSQTLFKAAKKHIAGGVNSPVRAFNAVDGTPLFIAKAQGAYIYDSDLKEYIDYVGSWGPMILGHAHPDVIKAVQATAENGLSFGAPTELETAMANKICQLMPSIEKVRMVNSGTEAAMSAIRLARGFTKRDKIIKFEGCYHGHADSLLAKAGSGALTLSIPSSQGVPADTTKHTITLSYNNPDHVTQTFQEIGAQIAAIIVEPIAGNMNCIPATQEFLQTLSTACKQHQSLLIFDEVMSGFRVALGGAQSIYGITPDLTILGKIIGGGMPVGAFGGRQEIMNQLAPDGPVYQAGTLSGNPIAMRAGLTTLELISTPHFFEQLTTTTQTLLAGLQKQADTHGIALSTQGIGGMFGLFFSTAHPITNLQQAKDSDQKRFKTFFNGMLDQGIYIAPSAFEAGFVSSAHSAKDIDKTIETAGKVMAKL